MASSNLFYKYKIHHLIFWMLLFAGWFYFRYQDFSTINKALLITFIKVADLAMMVYITNYILIPKLLYKKQYLLFGIIFILMIFCSSIFKINLIAWLLNPSSGFTIMGDNFKLRAYDNIIPHFLLVSSGAAFKLLLDYAATQKKLGEMAKEKAESELLFLKSQMNPHFLFNSLNSVYFLIEKSNTAARDALHKFSEMLRYQLYDVGGTSIPVEKEISYIRDYIDLQKLRGDANNSIAVNIAENVQGFNIEPLLLLPFVENSFKHLSHYSNGKQNEIKIDLSKRNGELCFSIKNTTEGKNMDVIEAGGIGLINVKRRLGLLYPDQHILKIDEKDGWFEVLLNVKIPSS